ncbi:hypothetical protein [Desulfosarcina variabilis]|uniref:hypothetical protein n=1 Tax=Desulfosarcina variabilis TaxID=2300 RepID=UPI003AFAD6CA
MTVHVLIRGDLTGRLPQTASETIRRNDRPGNRLTKSQRPRECSRPTPCKETKGATRMDIGCLFVRNASAGNRPGDRSEVSRGHSSPTPGVMAGTW